MITEHVSFFIFRLFCGRKKRHLIMSRVVPPSQQKLAEKLTILNDRMVGLLTRLYQMKKYMSNPSLRPRYLHEKAFEGALKALMKKFPNVDTRSNTSSLLPLANIKADIMNQLAIYYHTLVDILELKDHVNELLTRMDAYQVFMHITLNFDVTKNYLDLVANYVAIMILLSRIEERKPIVAIYNYAYELCYSKGKILNMLIVPMNCVPVGVMHLMYN